MKDGGPAFPHDLFIDENGHVTAKGTDGMSLRDWFAGNVDADSIATICNKADREKLTGLTEPPMSDGISYLRYNMAVEAAVRYIYADAMLAAREKQS